MTFMMNNQDMQTKTKILTTLLLTVLLISSCATGMRLNTEYINTPHEFPGKFSVILYGARHIEDVETVAILDIEGDGYEMIPYALEYDFIILKGLTGNEAFLKAKDFIGFHRDYWTFGTRKIFGEKGSVIGYELMPLYTSRGNPLRLSYYLDGEGRVKVYIQALPEFRRLFFPFKDD